MKTENPPDQEPPPLSFSFFLFFSTFLLFFFFRLFPPRPGPGGVSLFVSFLVSFFSRWWWVVWRKAHLDLLALIARFGELRRSHQRAGVIAGILVCVTRDLAALFCQHLMTLNLTAKN